MKTSFLISLLMLALTSLGQNTLSVEIKGINHLKKGDIRVGIFNEKGFLDNNKVIIGKIVKVTKSIVNVEFDLPNGIYAVAVIHDIDKNGKLSKNLFGYPIEPYAFSNNSVGNLGPPAFKDALIKLNTSKKISIVL
jgi:uncharacterized protein (DUF2141 family)